MESFNDEINKIGKNINVNSWKIIVSLLISDIKDC